jgi:hypothetical protein
MNFTETIGVVGSIASIVSIGGALFSWSKAKKAKKYSDIYYTTDTKEKLQTVFVHLEAIQDLSYKLHDNTTRGINKNNELKEYEAIRNKIDNLINLTPSNYNVIITKLNHIRTQIDSAIQKKEIMNTQDLIIFKSAIPTCMADVKKELEGLRKNLALIQSN